MKTLFVLLLTVVALAACGSGVPPAEGDQEVSYFSGEGEYLFHTAAETFSTVTINHREIPGFMSAMAMPFPIEDPSLVEGLRPGQAVTFRVVVRKDGYYYVDRIERVATEEP